MALRLETDLCSSTGGDEVIVVGEDGDFAGLSPLRGVLSWQGGQGAVNSGKAQSKGLLLPIGNRLAVYTPPVPTGLTSATLTLTGKDGSPYTFAMRVTAPFYGSQTFNLRSKLPATWALGPRDMTEVT